MEVDRELLAELKEAYKANNGAYPAAHILNFVRDRLRSMPCKNQGYVLDGFPTTTEEANELFKCKTYLYAEQYPIKIYIPMQISYSLL